MLSRIWSGSAVTGTLAHLIMGGRDGRGMPMLSMEGD